MTGAKGLQAGVLTGQIMLNLDTEEDNELTIGCAGGVDVTANHSYAPQATPAGMTGVKLFVRGLKGGHSGVDIHLGRANANKIMNRILWMGSRQFGLAVSRIDGGGLRNAIPRESVAEIVLPDDQVESFKSWFETESHDICTEYKTTDPNTDLGFELMEVPTLVVPDDVQKQLLGVVYACPNGIHRFESRY